MSARAESSRDEPVVILAGDVGGTKTALALFENGAAGLREIAAAEFDSRTHGSLAELAGGFLRAHSSPVPRAACFGVAGPVTDGQCRTTNLPWRLDEAGLASALGITRVRLFNDLQATAYGMLSLAPERWHVLNAGVARPGTIAVIAAGTGLGTAVLYWDGRRHHPLPSEGGHVDFAPRTEREIALLGRLRQRWGGHVSCERVVSGPGLHAMYVALREAGGETEPEWLAVRLRGGDPSAVIAEIGLAGKEAVCAEALDVFVAAYGAAAGNLALTAFAVGGVFLGGGIAPKILPALCDGRFMAAFADKGRFGEWLRRVPVRVALEPRAALLGAARAAAELAAEGRP